MLHGKISGSKLTIAITPELQQPAPGTFSALLDLTTELSKTKGSKALLTSDGLQVQEALDRRQGRLRPEPEPAGAVVGLGHRRREVLVVLSTRI